MAALGDGHQLSNFEVIETQGDITVGMGARGGGPSELEGANLEIVNAGHISTNGDQAIGVALGVTRPEFGFFRALDSQIVNSGVIETVGDGSAGALMIGDGLHLTNSGRITTNGGSFFDGPTVDELRAAGVVVSGDDALVENTRTGVIESLNGASAAVELNVLVRADLSNATTSSTLENFGLIEGAGIAVLGGDGQETLINHGSIVGDVNLGSGDDKFVFATGGSVAGDVVLGAGNDLVVVENGSGTTSIADFAAGTSNSSVDVIDVSTFFSSFEEMTDHISVEGGNVVIALDANDTLVLENVVSANLNSDDFWFG